MKKLQEFDQIIITFIYIFYNRSIIETLHDYVQNWISVNYNEYYSTMVTLFQSHKVCNKAILLTLCTNWNNRWKNAHYNKKK